MEPTAEFPNIRHLLAFREVAEQKGVSAAAARVHLSQPAVTQAIAQLEKKLDLRLFDRRPEGMFVSRQGQIFLSRVQRILAHLEYGAAQAVRASGPIKPKPKLDFHKNVSASQLRALVAIWETGNFSMAARRIGISQPSVHRAGRSLEKLAGLPFYIVNRNGLELTPAAELFVREVKLAAAELRQGYDEIAQSKGRDSTKIAVGSMPLSRTSILPMAIDGLLDYNHGVQVRNVDGPYDELLKGLRYGDLDVLIGALRNPVPADDIVQEKLFDDPLAIVAGPHHPLAVQQKVTLSEALNYPWIAPPRSTPTGSYLFHTLEIDKLVKTPIRIVSSSLVLVRGLLSQGNYLTILSLHQMAVEQAQGLMVPLSIDLPNSTRPIGLTMRKSWNPTPTQSRFLELIRSAA
jgi:LysR family transcriptional regulator of gallate degradation